MFAKVRLCRLLYIAEVLILIFCLATHWIFRGAGDKDWFLLASEMMLNGKRLYVDISTVVLPLIFYFNALSVMLSRWIGSSVYSAHFAVGLGCIILSIACSTRLLSYHPVLGHNKAMRWQAIMTFCFMFLVWTNPMYFLDREHIFYILTLPYVIRFLPGVDAGREAIPLKLRSMLSVMAAIGFCIKPYCLLLPMMVTLLTLVRRRSFRALFNYENIIILLLLVAYALACFLLYAEYVFTILPIALATYWAVTDGGRLFYSCVACFIASVTLFNAGWNTPTPLLADVRYLSGICLSLFIYGMVNNGWGYTWNPLSGMLMLLTVWVLWHHYCRLGEVREDAAAVKKLRQSVLAVRANVVCNVALSLTFNMLALSGVCGEACIKDNGLETVVHETKAKNFGTISIDFMAWTHLVRATHARWDTRINQLWMLPALFVSDDDFRQRHQWVFDYAAHAFAEDMNRNKPELMFVDDTDMFYRVYHPVDLVAYFRIDPAFREAWSHYEFYSHVNNCPQSSPNHAARPLKKIKGGCEYAVYKRVN